MFDKYNISRMAFLILMNDIFPEVYLMRIGNYIKNIMGNLFARDMLLVATFG
jgi:hypothetical protein